MSKIHRILPPLLFLAALGAMLTFHKFVPGPILLTRPWHLVGILPMLIGLRLSADGVARLRRAHTTAHPGKSPDALVTEGAYRSTRNPMYLGLIVILSGIALYLGSLTPWVVIPLFALAMDRFVVVREEAVLEAHFGAAFREYRRRTRRWV